MGLIIRIILFKKCYFNYEINNDIIWFIQHDRNVGLQNLGYAMSQYTYFSTMFISGNVRHRLDLLVPCSFRFAEVDTFFSCWIIVNNEYICFIFVQIKSIYAFYMYISKVIYISFILCIYLKYTILNSDKKLSHF